MSIASSRLVVGDGLGIGLVEGSAIEGSLGIGVGGVGGVGGDEGLGEGSRRFPRMVIPRGRIVGALAIVAAGSRRGVRSGLEFVVLVVEARVGWGRSPFGWVGWVGGFERQRSLVASCIGGRWGRVKVEHSLVVRWIDV
jgi:hypothetical protein